MGRGRTRVLSVALPLVAAAPLLCAGTLARAQPAIVMEEGEEDDASLTLTMREQLILSDPLVWCEIAVLVGTEEVELTAGDTVSVSLIEDDAVLNDTVWTEEHVITDEEAASGAFESTFDCSAMGKKDGIGTLEFFGQVDVDKAGCTGLCFNDNPSTGNVTVEAIEDDEHEEDDSIGQASEAEQDTVIERVAADDDYVRVLLQEAGTIEAQVEFMAACGEVEVEVVDEDGGTVAASEAGQDSASASASNLAPGAYFVLARPASSANLNFYDLTVSAEFDPDATTGPDDTNGETGDSDSDSSSDSDSNSNSNASNTSATTSDPSGGSGTAGEETDGFTAGEDRAGESDGCGCRHAPSPAHALPLLLGILACRRRRCSS